MTHSSRLFPLVLLLLGLGALPALAQSSVSSSAQSALKRSDEVSDAPSSVVLRDEQATPSRSVGANTALQGDRSETASLPLHTTPLRTASVNLPGFDAQSTSTSQMSTTRKVLYIVGGVVIVGGAVAGILALGDGGGDGPANIPPPPGRPQ